MAGTCADVRPSTGPKRDRTFPSFLQNPSSQDVFREAACPRAPGAGLSQGNTSPWQSKPRGGAFSLPVRRQPLASGSPTTLAWFREVSRETKRLGSNTVLVFPGWKLTPAVSLLHPYECPHVRSGSNPVSAAAKGSAWSWGLEEWRGWSPCAKRRATRPSPLVVQWDTVSPAMRTSLMR